MQKFVLGTLCIIGLKDRCKLASGIEAETNEILRNLDFSEGRAVPVADLAMGGPGGRSPIDQNLGLVLDTRSSLYQTWGQVFI